MAEGGSHGRGGRGRRAEDIEESFWNKGVNPEEGEYLVIRLDSGQPMGEKGWPWIQKGIRGILGEHDKLDKAFLVRDGGLVVKAKNREQTEKLKRVQHFSGERCEIRRDRFRNISKGTIFAPDLLHLDENEVVGWLAAYGVVEARRTMKTARSGEKTKTPILLLTFDSPTCPDKIQLDYMSYSVRIYVPPPMLCYRCGVLGHISTKCGNRPTCLDCGRETHEGECEKRCVNCKANGHSCLDKEKCVKWQTAKEICTIKATLNISYGQAKKEHQKRSPQQTSIPFSGAVRATSEMETRIVSDLKAKVDRMEQRMEQMVGMMEAMMGRREEGSGSRGGGESGETSGEREDLGTRTADRVPGEDRVAGEGQGKEAEGDQGGTESAEGVPGEVEQAEGDQGEAVPQTQWTSEQVEQVSQLSEEEPEFEGFVSQKEGEWEQVPMKRQQQTNGGVKGGRGEHVSPPLLRKDTKPRGGKATNRRKGR